jgi:hypothetical protein
MTVMVADMIMGVTTVTIIGDKSIAAGKIAVSGAG